MTRLVKSLVLVGMMGSGKTVVGAALARALGAPFLDSDDEIERAANRSIAEIFARDGEAFFREKEARVLERLLAGPAAVIATGGGAYVAEANRRAIAARGVAVWLRADPDLLWQRVRHKPTRPLLRTPDPRGTLAGLMAARAACYAQAEVIVDAVSEFSADEMAQRVQAAVVGVRPDVFEAAA